MIFIGSVILCVFLSILCYTTFDRTMRFSKVSYKHFSLKAQRIVDSLIGIVFIVPLVVVRLVNPDAEKEYWYILIAAVLTSFLFTLTLEIIGRKTVKSKQIQEKIIELKLENSNDLLMIKKELKSWYDISASIKEIESALKHIQETKNVID